MPEIKHAGTGQLRTALNKDGLNRIAKGEETLIITRGGLPIAQVTAITLPFVATSGSPVHMIEGSAMQWYDSSTVNVDPNVVIPSTTNTFTTSGDATFTRDVGAVTDKTVENLIPPPATEDALDIETAKKSLAEPGTRPWNEVREELGLDGEGPSEDGADWVKAKTWDKRPLTIDVNATLADLRVLLSAHHERQDQQQILFLITVGFKAEATQEEFEEYRRINKEIRKAQQPCDDGT